MDEVQRWVRVFSCDVLCLQECESAEAYRELLGSHELVAAVEARETRGWVHVYVRRGLSYERLLSQTKESVPGVVVRVDVDAGERGVDAVVVAGVHLPTGDCASQRRGIVEQVVASCGAFQEQVVVLGDMNMKDAEVRELCQELELQDAWYTGASWGVRGNRFYRESNYTGPGLRKDRVLFGKKVWGVSHLVGQGKVFF